MRAAAASAAGRSNDLKDIEVQCDCTTDCSNNRCNCKKKQLPCNSHYHGKKSLNSKCCKNRQIVG